MSRWTLIRKEFEGRADGITGSKASLAATGDSRDIIETIDAGLAAPSASGGWSRNTTIPCTSLVARRTATDRLMKTVVALKAATSAATPDV